MCFLLSASHSACFAIFVRTNGGYYPLNLFHHVKHTFVCFATAPSLPHQFSESPALELLPPPPQNKTIQSGGQKMYGGGEYRILYCFLKGCFFYGFMSFFFQQRNVQNLGVWYDRRARLSLLLYVEANIFLRLVLRARETGFRSKSFLAAQSNSTDWAPYYVFVFASRKPLSYSGCDYYNCLVSVLMVEKLALHFRPEL